MKSVLKIKRGHSALSSVSSLSTVTKHAKSQLSNEVKDQDKVEKVYKAGAEVKGKNEEDKEDTKEEEKEGNKDEEDRQEEEEACRYDVTKERVNRRPVLKAKKIQWKALEAKEADIRKQIHILRIQMEELTLGDKMWAAYQIFLRNNGNITKERVFTKQRVYSIADRCTLISTKEVHLDEGSTWKTLKYNYAVGEKRQNLNMCANVSIECRGLQKLEEEVYEDGRESWAAYRGGHCTASALLGVLWIYYLELDL